MMQYCSDWASAAQAPIVKCNKKAHRFTAAIVTFTYFTSFPESPNLIQRLRSVVKKPVQFTHRSLNGLWEVQNRERERVWREVAEMRGLMQLLMKQRNGEQWTDADRRSLRLQLRKLASLSPYMVLFLSPGGFLALPILAWWLDRRRRKRLSPERRRAAKEG